MKLTLTKKQIKLIDGLLFIKACQLDDEIPAGSIWGWGKEQQDRVDELDEIRVVQAKLREHL